MTPSTNRMMLVPQNSANMPMDLQPPREWKVNFETCGNMDNVLGTLLALDGIICIPGQNISKEDE